MKLRTREIKFGTHSGTGGHSAGPPVTSRPTLTWRAILPLKPLAPLAVTLELPRICNQQNPNKPFSSSFAGWPARQIVLFCKLACHTSSSAICTVIGADYYCFPCLY
ncbi:hypothetical protein QCA50_020111 [Cerrena zonata]|uniref:Uncharacterized protein n=1 Tax=Cerrena zonata TaxID=2478898 RepID=A0AAW0FHW9_9APHY